MKYDFCKIKNYEIIDVKDNIIYTKENDLYGFIYLDNNYEIITEVKPKFLSMTSFRWKDDYAHYTHYMYYYIYYFNGDSVDEYIFYCNNVIPYDSNHVIIENELVSLSDKSRMKQLREYYYYSSFIDFIKINNGNTESTIKKLIKK